MNTKENFKKLTDEAKSRIKQVSVQDVSAATGPSKPIIVDIREKEDFAKDHIPGAINIPRGTIEHDIASVAPDPSTPIVCYCGGGGRSALAVDMLQKMGYSNAQSLEGGVREWKAQGLPIDNVGPTSPADAFANLSAQVKARIKETTVSDVSSGNTKGQLIDVRDPDEFAAGHIPGALPASRGTIESKITKLAPDTTAPLILYCGGGTRSAFAADMLQQMGYTKVFSMQGGIREWKAQNLPLEK